MDPEKVHVLKNFFHSERLKLTNYHKALKNRKVPKMKKTVCVDNALKVPAKNFSIFCKISKKNFQIIHKKTLFGSLALRDDSVITR